MKVYKSIEDNQLIEQLKSGDIGTIPTDTIYGIVTGAFNQSSVEKLYNIKNRNPNKPFIILISEISDLEKFHISLDDDLNRHLNRYWPGPYSIILKCEDDSFSYLSRRTKTLAFRLPDNEVLRGLLRAVGPLVAPSANPEGDTPAYDFDRCVDYFGEKIDFYVDAGRVVAEPSNIIDLTDVLPVVIR